MNASHTENPGRRYFASFVRAVEAACAREGRSAGAVASDGGVGLFGLTVDRQQAIARRHGFGDVTIERLLAAGPLQARLGEQSLAECWQEALAPERGQAPGTEIRRVVDEAARAWYRRREADRKCDGGDASAASEDAFAEAVVLAMGLARGARPWMPCGGPAAPGATGGRAALW